MGPQRNDDGTVLVAEQLDVPVADIEAMVQQPVDLVEQATDRVEQIAVTRRSGNDQMKTAVLHEEALVGVAVVRAEIELGQRLELEQLSHGDVTRCKLDGGAFEKGAILEQLMGPLGS